MIHVLDCWSVEGVFGRCESYLIQIMEDKCFGLWSNVGLISYVFTSGKPVERCLFQTTRSVFIVSRKLFTVK